MYSYIYFRDTDLPFFFSGLLKNATWRTGPSLKIIIEFFVFDSSITPPKLNVPCTYWTIQKISPTRHLGFTQHTYIINIQHVAHFFT